jgi:dipeptidyl aminopeptidase/acylaminoacyl peptidase
MRMPRHLGLVLTVLTLVTLTTASPSSAQRNNRSALEIALNFQGVTDDVRFSPNGDALAWVQMRQYIELSATPPVAELSTYREPTISDVWVRTRGSSLNLTQGVIDHSGWWQPRWSPQGRYLAMLSTRGAHIGLWLWDSQTNQLQEVARSVFRSSDETFPFTWVDEQHVICSCSSERRTDSRTSEEPLTVYRTVGPSDRPIQGAISIIDVRGGSRLLFEGASDGWTLSPDRQILVFGLPNIRPPAPNEPYEEELPSLLWHLTYQIKALDLGSSATLFSSESEQAFPWSVRWSTDSRFFSFVQKTSAGMIVQRVDVHAHTANPQPLRGLTLDSLEQINSPEFPFPEWTGDRHLLVYARSEISSRSDWWRLGENRNQNLTARLRQVFQNIRRVTDGFVGVADGHLYLMADRSDEAAQITALSGLDRIADTQAESTDASRTATPRTELAFESADGSYALLNMRVHTSVLHIEGHPRAQLIDFSPQSNQFAFLSRDEVGTRLFLTGERPTEAQTTIAWLNPEARDIPPAQVRRVRYAGPMHQTLTGWLLLPPNARRGAKYPVVVWVYPHRYGDDALDMYTSNDIQPPLFNPYHPRFFLDAGYAVLLPSIVVPPAPTGNGLDFQNAVTPQVLAALDAAVRTGEIDGDNAFIGGHSWGGYLTYLVLTQTARFRGGISLAGASNMFSLYGQFYHSPQRGGFAAENLYMMPLVESDKWRLGVPWENAQSYIRDSPLMAAGNISSPALILQGDDDFVPSTQGEEMFHALYRQGKDATFLLYHREGHQLQDPSNIRDAWERIIHWLNGHQSHVQ